LLPGGSRGPVIDGGRGHGSDSAILMTQTRWCGRPRAASPSQPGSCPTRPGSCRRWTRSWCSSPAAWR